MIRMNTLFIRRIVVRLRFPRAARNGADATGWRDNVAEIAYRDGVKPGVMNCAATSARWPGAPRWAGSAPAAPLYEQGDDAMVAD
jgi:hypothetical protein